MKAYEFPAKVTPEGRLEFPESLLQHLPSNQQVRVIILVSEPTEEEEEEAAWHRLAAEQFFTDYSNADAIYDIRPNLTYGKLSVGKGCYC